MALRATHNETTFNVGDTVRVHYRIIEREKTAGKTKKSVTEEVKERVQPFEGVVIGIKGSAENKSFTVRRLADMKIGVERVFPFASPWIEQVEVKQLGKVRRAKLNYLRERGNLDIKHIRPETKKEKKARESAEKHAASKSVKAETKKAPAKKSPAKAASSKKGKSGGASRKKTSSK